LRPGGFLTRQNAHDEIVVVLLKVAQHLQDALGEMLVDIGVLGNGLGYLRGGVVIPVVLPAVANKHAVTRFELPDGVFPFHRSDSSASLRTPGISPLVKS
jgi:hypothetical protein